MPPDEARAEHAGDLVNEAQGYVVRALRALSEAGVELKAIGFSHVTRVVSDPGERSLTGRDISIAITELEGVLLRLRHGTPER